MTETKRWRCVRACLWLMTAAFTTPGCAYHVVFPDRKVEPAIASSPPYLDVYVDADGGVYPPEDVEIDERHMLRSPNETIRSYVRSQIECSTCKCPVSLSSYAPYSEFCAGTARIEEDDGSATPAWQASQIMQWHAIAEKAKHLVPIGHPLVILIHGYNVPSAKDEDTDYNFLRARVAAAAKEIGVPAPGFIQIHWDGMKGLKPFWSDDTWPVGPWNEAQANGPLVGLYLRYLGTVVESVHPIRVVTHSSGAFVAAALIGDSSRALPLADDPGNDKGDCKRNYRKFCAAVHDKDLIPVPTQRDLRVAMIAPATPSLSFRPDHKGDHGILSPDVTLIVGGNHRDFATSKLRLLSRLVGSSSLGGNREEFSLLADGLEASQKTAHSVRAHFLDFSSEQEEGGRYMRDSCLWDNHGVQFYWQRKNRIAAFLTLLLQP